MASSLNPRNEFRFFRNKKFNPVEIAIEIALNQGKIAKRYSVTTVRRWIQRLGLNFRAFFRDLAAIHLDAEHPNHVWLIDATPFQGIYLDRGGSIVFNPQIPIDKNHGDDILRKKDLRKVWLYFVVDKFSGAFLIKVYARENLGENPTHWAETLRYAMSKNEDFRIPMAGIPVNIYADGGAISGGILKKYFEYFDILAVSHAPGKSRATGAVESRIGQFKKTIETLFNSAIKPSDFYNSKLEALQHFCHEWCIRVNLKRNLFNTYTEHLKYRQEVTDQHFVYAGMQIEDRRVDNFGEISLENKKYYVNTDLVKTPVQVMRRYPDLVLAKDIYGKVHICTDKLNRSVLFKKKADIHESRFKEGQDAVVQEAREFKLNTSTEDLLPNKIFAIQSSHVEAYTIKTAWEFLLAETNYSEDEIKEGYKELFCELFRESLETHKHISNEVMGRAVGLLTEYMKKEQKEANNQ